MKKNFNERCYDVLRKVPRGKVTTYKEIAKAFHSKAYRAVGNAMNNNPHAPQVPCHRVINSDGFVGQFANGIKSKVKMLKSEGVFINKNNLVDMKRYFYKLK